MRRAFVTLAHIAPVALAVACASREPRGQLTLSITSDLVPGVDFDRLQIEVRKQGVATHFDTFRDFGQPGLEASFPATYAIVGTGAADEVHVRVLAGKVPKSAAEPRNVDIGKPGPMEELVARIPATRNVLVRIHLSWLCRNSGELLADGYVEGACPEGQHCVGGTCAEWTLDPERLPDFAERDVFGGGSAAGEGTCFDTLRCFDGATVVEPDADCTLPKPKGTDINVALVPAPGQGGICAGSTCFVPLDEAPTTAVSAGLTAGWVEDAGRIRLPRAVCAFRSQTSEKIQGDTRVRAVVLSTLCPPKRPAQPTCGAWSAIKSDRGARDAGAPRGLDAAGD